MKKSGQIDPLIDLLDQEEKNARRVAAQSLGAMNDERALKALIPALEDRDEVVRTTAAESLKSAGSLAVAPLIDSLQRGDIHTWVPAVEILGELGDSRAAEPLILALNHKSRALRAEAAKALGKIKDPRAVPPLIGILRDDDHGVRTIAAHSLEAIGEPAIEPLIETLRDDDIHVRVSAVIILGNLRDPRAVEPLMEALYTEAREHKSWALRTELARSLGKIKDPRGADALNMVIGDKDTEVRETAEWALQQIEGDTDR
jgi:HEAT repeat protein